MSEKTTIDLSKVKFLVDEEVKEQQEEQVDQIKKFSNEFRKKIEPFIQIFKKVIKSVQSFFHSLAKWVTRNVKCMDYSQKNKQQKQRFKLNLQRPIIKHQVLDCKPKNLVRKVCR